MTGNLLRVTLLTALIVGSYPLICNAANYGEAGNKVQKGQSKQTILALLGEPGTKITTVKQKSVIWGPEEEFWDDIPLGTRLEVWKYTFSDGQLNLYFINEGEYVDYRAWAPKGVVY